MNDFTQHNWSPTNRRNSTSDRLKPGPSFAHPVTFHYAIHNHTTRIQKITRAFKVYRLVVLTVVCVLAGIIIGLICRPFAKRWSERHFMYIEVPVYSFGTIQGKISSRLGKVASSIYLISNVVAISLAVIIALICRPGQGFGGTVTPIGVDQTDQLQQAAQLNYGYLGNRYLNEYHESISRYREYHPMSFHTTNSNDEAGGKVHQVAKRSITPNHEDNRQFLPPPPANGRFRSSIFDSFRRKFATPEQQNINDEAYNAPNHNHSKPSETFTDLAFKLEDELNELIKLMRHENYTLFKEINQVGLHTRVPTDVFLDFLRNIVPDSFVGAALQQTRTRLFAPIEMLTDNLKNGNIVAPVNLPPPNRWPIGYEMTNQPNVLGLLAMSVMAGVALSYMNEAAKPLLDLCSCVSELTLRIGSQAIQVAPICIMFLLIGQIARARNLSLIAGELLMYSITVILALMLHAFVILPLIYYFVTKKSPLKFFNGLLEALVASFASSSSGATMALMLNCLADLDLNLVIVRAFGPLSSVFNMNGTAIYEVVGVIFIAQTLGVQLSIASILLIGVCSAVASLSTSGVPSSGAMTMVIVLNAIDLPVLQLSLIYIVDFIIDRFRTVVNVWSGAIACGLIDHLCPEQLFEEEMEPEKYREMVKQRLSRGSLGNRKSVATIETKPQVISVTITPPSESSRV